MELDQEIEFLYNRYKNVKIPIPVMKHPLRIDREFLQHFFLPDIWLDYKRGNLKLAGFHHDFNNQFHKSGFLIQKNIKIINGALIADICIGNKYKVRKTLFPSEMNRIELLDNIFDSCKNVINVSLQKDGKYRIETKMKNDLKIELYSTISGLLKTTYPKRNI